MIEGSTEVLLEAWRNKRLQFSIKFLVPFLISVFKNDETSPLKLVIVDVRGRIWSGSRMCPYEKVKE